MLSRDIRQSFLDYFASRGHRHLPSAPLVPHGDPTLLFTNAGMVQFKDAFVGVEAPPAPRAVTVQKCLRVSGKHNDLENVGPSPRHHTFFEMLGNFSFGDYFKEEAIRFGWELVTGVWGLSPERLAATVFEEDDEAATLWRDVAGLPPERIHRCGARDNFWAMGETGPCGPCSEIFVDCAPQLPAVGWEEGTASGRYLEIWNLVFMQYERDAAGALAPLPHPSIDTGAGLERVAAVLQGVDSNYDTDLFRPLLEAAATLADGAYGRDPHADVSLRVVADHLRALAFLLVDGVIPGNEGRGYVLRRILRRAVRHGMGLGFQEPFLHRLVPVLTEIMGEAYPELQVAESASAASIKAEEEKFLATLASAARQVQEAVDRVRQEGGGVLPGEVAFRLYDTYGLPLEVIREIVQEEGIRLDEGGFEERLDEQRRRSRTATGATQRKLRAVLEALRGEDRGPTEFVGYERLRTSSPVRRLARLESGAPRLVEALEPGESGIVVLATTPFYAEAGGQVGDRGSLSWPGGRAEVVDTQKDGTGTHFHFVEAVEGRLEVDTVVEAEVHADRRRATERNHTATHLLHAALRHVLGPEVRQAGSLVAPDRLRFDFTHGRPMTAEELRRVEALVNRWVLTAQPTVITPDRPYDEAVAAGAMALFGEKYGDRVRTVEVGPLSVEGGEGGFGSLELCGGCHVTNVGAIGPLVIVSERGIASGVRRIEALSGEGALAWLTGRRELAETAASRLGVPPERLADEVASLQERLRGLGRELSDLRLRLVTGAAGDDSQTEVEGVRVVAREVPPAPLREMRSMADVLRSRLGSGVVVLATREGAKASLITAVSHDLAGRLDAGRLVKTLAPMIGGSGGGRADFAQAGGKDPGGLPAMLAAVPDAIREQLASRA